MTDNKKFYIYSLYIVMLQYNDPKIWGPHFWFMMRCVAYNFPDNATIYDSRYYIDFYTNIKYILPCEKCKLSYNKLMDKYPIDQYAKDKTKLMSWVEIMYQETDKEIKAQQKKSKSMIKIAPKPVKKFKNSNIRGLNLRHIPRPSPPILNSKNISQVKQAKGGCNCGK